MLPSEWKRFIETHFQCPICSSINNASQHGDIPSTSNHYMLIILRNVPPPVNLSCHTSSLMDLLLQLPLIIIPQYVPISWLSRQPISARAAIVQNLKLQTDLPRSIIPAGWAELLIFSFGKSSAISPMSRHVFINHLTHDPSCVVINKIQRSFLAINCFFH